MDEAISMWRTLCSLWLIFCPLLTAQCAPWALFVTWQASSSAPFLHTGNRPKTHCATSVHNGQRLWDKYVCVFSPWTAIFLYLPIVILCFLNIDMLADVIKMVLQCARFEKILSLTSCIHFVETETYFQSSSERVASKRAAQIKLFIIDDILFNWTSSEMYIDSPGTHALSYISQV